jgi:hypothetical protein
VYSCAMGIFGTKPKMNQAEIVHTATWPQNSVRISITKSGLSFSPSRPFQMMDETMCEAAIAQLERAYHLAVSYPDAEKAVLSFWSSVSSDVDDDAKIDFNWQPALPA